MNTIPSLVALLNYIDQIARDFNKQQDDLTEAEVTAYKERIAARLADADVALAALTAKLIGEQDGGGGQVGIDQPNPQ